MCLLCIEIAKGKMTSREIASAYAEIGSDNPHANEILKVLDETDKLDGVRDALLDMAVEYQEKD